MVIRNERTNAAEEGKGESISDYFAKHASKSEYAHLSKRASNALERGGIRTMDALAHATKEEITRVRNIGEKCLALVFMLRGQYAAEHRTRLDSADGSHPAAES